MDNISAIILAAGEGTRMKSKLPKVLHPICGKPLVQNVADSAKELGVKETIIVIGHGADRIKDKLGDVYQYALQQQQLGTGHAVMQAVPCLSEQSDLTLLLYGDTPLITPDSLDKLIKFHKEQDNKATVITAMLEDPTGYGRIVRSESGDVLKIVEQKDANDAEKAIKEINSGMYCFDTKALVKYIGSITNSNAQGEYYITDILEILRNEGMRVGAISIHPEEIMGVNNRLQLAQAHNILQKRIINKLMLEGVSIVDPANTYIHSTVKIARDTVIYPGVIIEGDSEVGEDCIIGPNTRLINSRVGNNNKIENSVVTDSVIGNGCSVGPFAYLRPGTKLGNNVKIGDFVEVKNSVIGDNSKASHLAYLGDADIGQDVNIGCGAVFVNYDGVKKHRSIIGDKAFVGCNVNIISPVRVEEGAYVAAGSTVTEDVPKDSLAIARSKQVIKDGWALKHRDK